MKGRDNIRGGWDRIQSYEVICRDTILSSLLKLTNSKMNASHANVAEGAAKNIGTADIFMAHFVGPIADLFELVDHQIYSSEKSISSSFRDTQTHVFSSSLTGNGSQPVIIKSNSRLLQKQNSLHDPYSQYSQLPIHTMTRYPKDLVNSIKTRLDCVEKDLAALLKSERDSQPSTGFRQKAIIVAEKHGLTPECLVDARQTLQQYATNELSTVALAKYFLRAMGLTKPLDSVSVLFITVSSDCGSYRKRIKYLSSIKNVDHKKNYRNFMGAGFKTNPIRTIQNAHAISEALEVYSHRYKNVSFGNVNRSAGTKEHLY